MILNIRQKGLDDTMRTAIFYTQCKRFVTLFPVLRSKIASTSLVWFAPYNSKDLCPVLPVLRVFVFFNKRSDVQHFFVHFQ